MSVLLSVYDPTLDFIGHIPKRQGLSFSEELNTPGACSFTMQLDDPVLKTVHPSILNRGRIVTVSVDGLKRRSYVITHREPVYGADGTAKAVTVQCLGVLGLLGHAIVYPEAPGLSGNLRWDQADDRAFDYGSIEGPWYVSGEWTTPVGYLQSNTTGNVRRGYPVKWPDRNAQWLWKTNPNASSAPQVNYFRGGFTLASGQRVVVFAAGDETMHLKLDGEEIMTVGRGGWKQITASPPIDLDAGYHLLAARVQGYQFEGANNPAGFLCSVARVDRNGKILSWIKRTTPEGFKVRQLLPGGYAPGWYAGQILKLLVNEGKERNVHTFDAMSIVFDDTGDTDGNPWTVRNDQTFPIGASYMDVLQRLVEGGLDVDMGPELELYAWNERGADLTSGVGAVHLLPSKGRGLRVPEGEGALKNRALVRGRNGWLQYNNAASESANGRRETLMSFGGALSDGQTQRLAVAGLADVQDPEVLVTAEGSSASGPQPYVDFSVGDRVTSVVQGGAVAACRVMNVSISEEASGELVWTALLYPVIS